MFSCWVWKWDPITCSHCMSKPSVKRHARPVPLWLISERMFVNRSQFNVRNMLQTLHSCSYLRKHSVWLITVTDASLITQSLCVTSARVHPWHGSHLVTTSYPSSAAERINSQIKCLWLVLIYRLEQKCACALLGCIKESNNLTDGKGRSRAGLWWRTIVEAWLLKGHKAGADRGRGLTIYVCVCMGGAGEGVV